MDLVGFLKQEDQHRLEQKQLQDTKKQLDYILQCESNGHSVVHLDTIPDWLKDKTGVHQGDILELEKITDKAIMITKMKPPLYRKIVLFQIWLPKSQIDYHLIDSEKIKRRLKIR